MMITVIINEMPDVGRLLPRRLAVIRKGRGNGDDWGEGAPENDGSHRGTQGVGKAPKRAGSGRIME
jgi:hypothetical protein